MGQGVATAAAMCVAEELGLELEALDVELAPGALAFRDGRGQQVTGYSSSVSGNWLDWRRLGASARHVLLVAAARKLRAPAQSLVLEAAGVRDSRHGRLVPLAELRSSVVTTPTVSKVPLSDPRQWRLLRTPQRRVEVARQVDGSVEYGIDVRVPEMRVAVIARPPAFGAVVARLDDDAARATRGVETVVRADAGVAVIGTDFCSAKHGRDALRVSWSQPSRAAGESQDKRLDEALARPGRVALARGDTSWSAVRSRPHRVEATYRLPFLAHAALEPLSAVAHVQNERCDLWLGTQAPSRAQQWAARLTGLPEERVFVHTRAIGGAFGRRGEWDYIVEAIELARQVRYPIKVMWTREDEFRHDFYRPASAVRIGAALDDAGQPTSLVATVAAPSIARRRVPDMLERGADLLLVQGLFDHLYDIERQRIDYHEVDLGVPVGFWRSVGHTHNVFALECFIDEVAHASRVDPLELRLRMLSAQPRMRAVLERAAAMAQWHSRHDTRRFLGVACASCYGTHVAQVVELRVEGIDWRVHCVYCAVDCGIAVNPAGVEQQLRGGIIYGLSAALAERVTLTDGAVSQSNYHDYPVLRFAEAPKISVDIIVSSEAPGGCGEPGTPPIAPALANAVAAATGLRMRTLPLRPVDSAQPGT
jgi:isoquinoline 1-oxidoreductase beta subunit